MAWLAQVARRIVQPEHPPPARQFPEQPGHARGDHEVGLRGQGRALALEMQEQLMPAPLEGLRQQRHRRFHAPQRPLADGAGLDPRPLIGEDDLQALALN
jgi:hypothetical protein